MLAGGSMALHSGSSEGRGTFHGEETLAVLDPEADLAVAARAAADAKPRGVEQRSHRLELETRDRLGRKLTAQQVEQERRLERPCTTSPG